ncbi:MAG: hypothetical protein EXQ64_07265 [Ilumatobacteraceae bacterium]|nr:hypothetical protein [Ilumatobacteraceae bacterium]
MTTATSLLSYVLRHQDESLQTNTAAWARNHQLNFVVDRLEGWLHSGPPSAKPADSLSLTNDLSLPIDTPSTTSPNTKQETPANLAPVISPALKDEGTWRVLASVGGQPVMWSTSIRPLASLGSVVASAVVIDQTRLTAGLFKGTEIPGSGPWNNYKRVMPAARPALVAAFNGGFRFNHIKSGYLSEGRIVRPLINGEATFGIRVDGSSTIGVLGTDMFNDGTWTTLRQNLPPVIQDGEISIARYPSTYWGNELHNVTYVMRSAICTLDDGRLLYVAAGDVDINALANVLLLFGCRTAMQLDINKPLPQFVTFTKPGESKRAGILLDKRMGNPNRYLNNATKDFFAFFDPALLPANLVK